MFIRQHFRMRHGRRHAYWALVESYRTARGPRQRVVAWLGNLDEAGRLRVQAAVDENNGDAAASSQQQLEFVFDDFNDDPDNANNQPEPRWVEVNPAAMRVENLKQFGGPWLALELIRRLKLDEFLERTLPTGHAAVPWSLSALVLVVARLLEPSSELHTSEQWYPKTALPELLGVPMSRVDDNRLYRTLDRLLPHKEALEVHSKSTRSPLEVHSKSTRSPLEVHLKNRLGELFDLEYDLLLYDVTSTFFEGNANFEMAQRGYSRDKRPDCKQVCIGLVVSRCGMPLGYEVFAGNTADSTTVKHVVETMERRYGKSDRVWVMDRGMVSEANIEWLREGGRRYLVGTPKSMLKRFEQELLKDDWHQVRDGLEVKLCTPPPCEEGCEEDAEGGDNNTSATTSESDESPDNESPELYILCRSRDRSEKEAAMVRRSEEKIEARLERMAERCCKQRRDPAKVEREVGRLLGQNTRAARLFDVRVEVENDETGKDRAKLSWTKREAVRDWASLSAGCYLLRTNVTDWSDEELWRAYIQLTEAEAAFRIHKSDLSLRPVWHQKEDRVLAHILVCFLAYVMWKTLAAWCHAAGLGDEPRRVLNELSEIRLLDVVLPTRDGTEIRTRCISKPTDHQQILLDHLGLQLPRRIIQTEM